MCLFHYSFLLIVCHHGSLHAMSTQNGVFFFFKLKFQYCNQTFCKQKWKTISQFHLRDYEKKFVTDKLHASCRGMEEM